MTDEAHRPDDLEAADATIEQGMLEELHARARSELRSARAEARRIRNEALDEADDLWLRAWQRAEREAAAIIDAARSDADAIRVAARNQSADDDRTVVPLRREATPPAPRLIASSDPVEPRRAAVVVVVSTVVATAAAATGGQAWPIVGVATNAAVLVALVHLAVRPTPAGLAARALVITPLMGMTRLALPVDVLPPAWWLTAVALPPTFVAIRAGGSRRGRGHRADIALAVAAAAAIAPLSVTVAWRPDLAAAGAIAGAALFGLAVAVILDGARTAAYQPVVAAVTTGVLATGAAGWASPLAAVVTATVATAVAAHRLAGGHLTARLLIGAGAGAVLALTTW